MTDTDSNLKIREHYGAIGLTARIKAALSTIAPESQVLTGAQLASLDQLYTRGILATAELAGAARLDVSTRVLDLGCGRRTGALSRSNFREQGARRQPQPQLHRRGHLPNDTLRTV